MAKVPSFSIYCGAKKNCKGMGLRKSTHLFFTLTANINGKCTFILYVLYRRFEGALNGINTSGVAGTRVRKVSPKKF